MGITIHYRGTMGDMTRVEEFEDRVLDLALEIGGSAQVWRSWPDEDPARVVRGLILELSPGQEATSLLIGPEGWLTPLHEIEAAENGTLTEPPQCWVKTQFGSVEGHVAVVELLSYLKQQFVPDLDVTDESGYWEHRDLKQLIGHMARLRAMIDGFAAKLRASPLSPEAAEDPQIVATRVERIAMQVQRTLARPPEHPPVTFDGNLDSDELDESLWDASFKEQRRKQERIQRAIADQLRSGADHSSAVEDAMRNEGLLDLPGEPDARDMSDELDDDDLPLDSTDGDDEFDHEQFEEVELEDHPLLEFASDLHLRVIQLVKEADEKQSTLVGSLLRGMGDITGGLAQALTGRDTPLDSFARGLCLVQLKRALRGAAFARGAVYPLQAAAVLSSNHCDELQQDLTRLVDGIHVELARIRETPGL